MTWLPFELHPETPPEGRARDDIDTNPRYRAVFDRLRALGEEASIGFDGLAVVANSHLALEAAEFAREAGPEAFAAFHRHLFRAYFEEGRNIGLAGELVEIGSTCGLDGESLRAALDRRSYAARVDDLVDGARRSGISSTPTFIVDERYAIPGAQPYEVFEEVMARVGAARRTG